MENTGFKFESRIFYFIDLQNEEDYERKKSSNTRRDAKQGVLSQFKTEADVSKFLKQLHAQVLEKMLEGEMDAHLAMKRTLRQGTIPATPGMAVIRRKSRPNMESLSFR